MAMVGDHNMPPHDSSRPDAVESHHPCIVHDGYGYQPNTPGKTVYANVQFVVAVFRLRDWSQQVDIV